MKRFSFLPLFFISFLFGHGEVDTEALPKVEDGFTINFFVREPHIINPSALCYDKHGRLYVGAGPQYRAPKEDSPTDYIKILVDADEDGVAETVKTFAEGLNSVQSMAWKGDELWVANAPELTVLRDTDGDDVADEYKIIYTGLNNLRHGLHGLNWGPDGWLYMSIGNTWVEKWAPKPFLELQGASTSESGDYPLTTVYTKDTYKKSYHALNKRETEGGIFRCRPGGYDLELYARGMRNPWDITIDTGFNWLGTDNDPGPPGERIFMPVPWGHYTMRHAWMFDWMGKHISVAPSSDLFPGRSGSGTGVIFNHSTHFPKEYRDAYFIADWTNNCIFFYRTKWDGSLQVPAEKKRKVIDGGVTRAGDLGYRGGEGRALFRPTDIEIGPDGALYMAGWGSVYGTKYVPKDKWTAEENAKYQGRVFRLRHKADPIPRSVWHPAKRDRKISEWTFDQLMDDIGHQLPVWRVHAQDELIRRGSTIRRQLAAALDRGILDESQGTWSLWALGHIDGKRGDLSEIMAHAKGRANSTVNLRVQAVRVLGEYKAKQSVPSLIQFLGDPEPRVRLAAIQSLGRIGWGGQQKAILDAVARETDRLTFYTSWQLMRRQVPVDNRRSLLADSRSGIRLMAALSLMEDKVAGIDEVIALQGDPDARVSGLANDWLRAKGVSSVDIKLGATELNFRDQSTVTMTTKSGYELHFTTDGSAPGKNSSRYEKPLTVKASTLIKAAAFKGGNQRSRTETLSLHRITESEWKDRLFVRNIQVKDSKHIYKAVDDGLQRGVLAFPGKEKETIVSVPDALAGATMIRTHPDDNRKRGKNFLHFDINLPAKLYVAVDTRIEAPDWVAFAFAKTGHTIVTSRDNRSFTVYAKDVPAGRVSLGDKDDLSVQLNDHLFFLSRTGQKKTSTPQAMSALPKANLTHGEEIFFGRGTCFACHQVRGRGLAVGPDLNAIFKRQDVKYVITSILEPDAYVVEGYQQTSLQMKDGRKLFGMILEETADALKLTLSTGEPVIVKPKDIKKRDDAKHSGMPASFAYTLSAQDTADLAAWIMSLK